MNERLHLPPTYTEINDQAPLVFLAGPIQGSPDWQNPTAAELLAHLPEVEVASPRRVSDTTFDYDEQVTWEKEHLWRAHLFGVIAIWMAARDFSQEYEAGRAYAKTTTIEVGTTNGWLYYNRTPVVIGIDPRYSESGGTSERYVRTLAHDHQLPVYDNLDDVIDQVIFQLPTSPARPSAFQSYRQVLDQPRSK